MVVEFCFISLFPEEMNKNQKINVKIKIKFYYTEIYKIIIIKYKLFINSLIILPDAPNGLAFCRGQNFTFIQGALIGEVRRQK